MKLYFWIENYLFGKRTFIQKTISIALLPLSFFWAFGVYIKKYVSKPKDFGIACIGVGNLTLGGSGKTPVTIALAQKLSKPAIVLRGYGRKSKGLKVVSLWGEIKCDEMISGDEAMLYAKKVAHALVIVAENRKEAILKAKELGAKCVLLDDAFSKFGIAKFNIVLQSGVKYAPFCIPSGPFRAPPSMIKFADVVLVENEDFVRKVKIENETNKMILATAIANAARLDKYLPKNVIAKIILPDHDYFDENKLKETLKKHSATSLLVTEKDLMKLQKSNLALSIMKLEIDFKPKSLEPLLNYLSRFHIGLDKISPIKQG